MDVECVAAATIYLMAVYNHYVNVLQRKVVKKKWKKRRWWCVSIHRNRTRENMDHMLAELLAEPSGEFENFIRMSSSDFNYLVRKISPLVAKQDTTWRQSIPVKIRLAITLRFLATGDSYRSLHYLFKVSSQIISRIIPEVCQALIKVLKDIVKIPSTTEEWLAKAQKFPFPHCLGALDGKHINILPPPHSASDYINYKGYFSIVLLALVDYDYSFMFAEVGAKGRISDGGVFNSSVLLDKITSNTINLPPPSPLPGCNIELPYVFLGDGAFPLSTNLMKPFPGYHALGTPQRLFNQELSRSRVVVENTFGIMASRFRVFKKPMQLCDVTASVVTMTCVLLHNFLRKSKTSRELYSPPGTADTYVNGQLVSPGSWRLNIDRGFTPLQSKPRRARNNAIQIRESFMIFLNNSTT